MKKNYIYFLLLFFIAVFGVLFFQNNNDEQGVQKVKIGGQVIKVDVADTPSERAQGLSDRESLPKNQGMLFVFDTPGSYSFWMKDMNFAIDMIWIDEEGRIVYIVKDARPESYPLSFGPKNEKTSKYVLEVFSGFSELHNLQIGDIILFLPS